MNSLSYEKDRLGLFDDGAMSVIRGEALRRLTRDAGYDSVKAFTKEIGIGRTKIYQDKIKVTGKIRDRLLELVRIYNNAIQLYKDESEARSWLLAPNKRFYNMSPLMMAMAGRGKAVYDVQEELLGTS
jgi:hypothetical protein